MGSSPGSRVGAASPCAGRPDGGRSDDPAGPRRGGDGFSRPRLLEPCVEILLALGEIDAARSAAEELARFAAATRAPLLQAVAARATGTVRLAEGEPRDALGSLRRSWTLWQDLEAPYEAARTRVHVGLACRALGDHDTAAIELEAARRVFEELGARHGPGGGPAPARRRRRVATRAA